MTLRTLQFVLIGLLVGTAGWQWRRDLDLRTDFAAEGVTRARLTADLRQARAEAEGHRQDLAELRTQLDRTRAQRTAAETENRRQAEEFIARTKDWQKALRGWEDAVKARDERIAVVVDREKLILTKLAEAVRHAEEATARTEAMRLRLEAKEANAVPQK